VEQGAGGSSERHREELSALNHLFQTGQGRATPAEYQREGHVAPEVVDDLAKWIAGH